MSRSIHVLVGVDGSPSATSALSWAVDAARSRPATVHAVHTWQPFVAGEVDGIFGLGTIDYDAQEQAARAVLDQVVDSVDASVLRSALERELVTGPAAATLIERAHDADLVVVGSRGRGGFAGLLLGSVSHQLVHHAPCPVVVVPEEWNGPRTGRIVVGVDGSDGARTALAWALEWAAPYDADIEVVLAFDSLPTWMEVRPAYQEQWLEEATVAAETEVRRIVEDVAPESAGATLHPVTELGTPARVLVERAKDADLLVVGSRGRGGFTGLLLGSVSQRCIETGRCPTVVVPASG